MAVSSIGVGSGLPLQELLKNMRTSESQVLNTISNRQKTEQNRKEYVHDRHWRKVKRVHTFCRKSDS